MNLTAINPMTLSFKTLICPEAAPKPLKPSTELVFAASGQSHQEFLAKYKEKDPSPPFVAPVDREDFLAKYKEKETSQPAVPLVINPEALLAKYSEKKSSAPAVPAAVKHEVFLASYSDEVPSRSMVTETADQENFLAKYQDEDSLSSVGSIDGDPEAHLAKFKETEEPFPQIAPVALNREAVLSKNTEGEPSPQTDRPVLDHEAMLAKYKEEDEEPSRRIIHVVVLDSADNSKSPDEWAAEAKAFAKRVSDALRREREERFGAMSEEETEESSRLEEDDYDD